MKSNIKTILRHIWKNKLFTLLNVIGLSIGISACWLVFSIVNYEFSFNQKIPSQEQIYQIYAGESDDAKSIFAGVPLGMAPLLESEALDDALIVPVYSQYFERLFIPQNDQNEDLVFDEQNGLITTLPSYFDLLPYEWIAGNSKSAFNDPNNIVLTEKRAREYFPSESVLNLIGRTFKADTTQLTVSGIVKNLDFPSSFQAQAFLPISEKNWQDHNWHSLNSNHNLYVRTSNLKSLEHLLSISQKRYDEIAKKDHEKYGSTIVFGTIPLAEKHFLKELDGGLASEKSVLYGLIGIGAFLLLLACINYINLSTAQVPMRAKEIGVRKTLGAKPALLTRAFILETLVISLFALVLSWPMISVFKKVYPEFVPQGITDFNNTGLVILFLVGLIVFISLLSGLYPAYLINKVRSIETLKGNITTRITGARLTLRKTLIIFQFVIAQFFIISALIIGQQLNFTLNKDLGFEHDAIVTIGMPYKSYQGADIDPQLYKDALNKHSDIGGVAMGHAPQSNNHWGSDFYLASDTGKIQLMTPRKYIDSDFIDLYKIKFLAGRNILETGSSQEVIINETALKKLGFYVPEQVLGQFLTTSNTKEAPLQIVGIIQDFHQKSLKSEMEPLVLVPSKARNYLQTFHIKLPENRTKWQETFVTMENEWKQIYHDAPFEYKFVDENIKTLYQTESRMAKLINLATGVTIFISVLGLFGLALLTAFQRIKEIGIRKVLGASITGIVAMLSKDFVKLVCLAIVIASPLAWWAMNKWLENFVYKIEIGPAVFLLAALVTVGIAMLTVSWQAIRGAVANPVDSLRDE